MSSAYNLPVKEIIVHADAESTTLGSEIIEKLKNSLPVVRMAEVDEEESPPGGAFDKASLHLTSFPGALLKACPGTKGYICCGYRILHLGTNCPMDCTYCILQAYFGQPCLKVFVNLKERLREVTAILDSHPERIFRLGTGEFMDSLALDPLVGWSEFLPPLISSRKNAILEFKTKTDRIKGLLSSKYRDRIVVSWSLNSPYIVAKEEHGSASLRKRLESARRCQEEGFVLGFHFDPIIEHRAWKEEYERTVDLMDRYVRPEGVIWISMGCLRYLPRLKKIIRERHPESRIVDREFVRGLDGKMRYIRHLRVQMYSHLIKRLKEWSSDLGVYLCMESHQVWRDSLGWSPGGSEGLSAYLDARVSKFFG